MLLILGHPLYPGVDGVIFDLTTPSAQQSGPKLKIAVSNSDTISTITNNQDNFKIVDLAKGDYDVIFDANSKT